MLRELNAYLTDIIGSGEEILAFIGEMTLEQYQQSSVVRAAVERKFTIIGEAITRLSDIIPNSRAG